MAYVKVTRGRNDRGLRAVGGDGSSEDEDVLVAIIPVVPERKLSRSHELIVAVLEGAEGVTDAGHVSASKWP